jgi:outer membrane protein TolC
MRKILFLPVKALAVMLTLVILFSTQCSAAQEIPASLTMGQAVARALQANPQLAAIRAQILGAEFGERSARSAFGPALSASYGMSYDDKPIVGRDRDIWTLNINLSQPLFTGWRLLSTYQRAALIQEQLETRLTATELQLILTVQEHFLNLLKAREQIRSAQDSVIRLQSHLQRAQAFYDVGLQPRVDVLSAEVELAQARQELLMSQNTVLTQTAKLNTLLNLDLEDQVDYVGKLAYLPYEPDLQDCWDKALANRPDILLSIKAEEIATKDLKITASAFYPQVKAELDYYRRGNDPGVSGDGLRPEPWWTASVGMQWQIFDWGKTRYAYAQARQNLYALRQETANLRLQVSYEVKSLHLKLREASARIKVARKALEEAREAFRIAQARYQAQVGTHTQVLDEQARLTRAEAGFTDALADYQFALARLFTAMGQQNPDLTIP